MIPVITQTYLENAMIHLAMRKYDVQVDLRLRRGHFKHGGAVGTMLLFEEKIYVPASQELHTGDFQSYLIGYVLRGPLCVLCLNPVNM